MSTVDIRQILEKQFFPETEHGEGDHTASVSRSLERVLSGSRVSVPEPSTILEHTWQRCQEREARRRRRTVRLPLAVAALVLCLVVGYVALRPLLLPLPTTTRVVCRSGQVRISGSKRQYTSGEHFSLAAGSALQGDDDLGLVLPLKSGGRLQFQGRGPLMLARLDQREKATTMRWRLDQGILQVSIPVAIYRRFEIRTPHALIAAVGTTFTVRVDDRMTRVKVDRGKVQVRHLDKTGDSGQNSVILEARETAQADPTQLKKIDPAAHEKRTQAKPDPAVTPAGRKQKTGTTTGARHRIRLHNGMVITGTIVSQNRELLVVRTPSGVLRIDRSRVRSVSYLR